MKRKRLGFFQYPYMVDGLLTGSSNLTQLTKVKLTDKKLTAGVVAKANSPSRYNAFALRELSSLYLAPLKRLLKE